VPSADEGDRSEERGARSEKYAAEIERCLAAAAHEEQVHRFALLDRAFAIERGEMTGKLSLCRGVIAKNFSAELQKLSAAQSTGRQADATTATPVL
jgi:long-subunit acyl-CoA synthetase (AMP-forming)